MSNITIEGNNDKFRGLWTPNTFYRQDDMVSNGNSLWIATANFTSGGVFDESNWFGPTCGGGGVPINTEQGFDLSIGLPGGHVYVGTDNATILNPTGTNISNCVLATVSHPHTDTTLRYFEYKLLYENGVNQSFVGYGSDEVGKFVGGGLNAAGYLTGLRQVRMQGTTNNIISVQPKTNDVVSVWTRGQRVWFAINSEYSGYDTTTGSDPYLDIAPSKILTATGELRPIATCHYTTSGVTLNTVGDFVYPPLPSAIPWDS